MEHMPTLKEVMTPFPTTAPEALSLNDAKALMRERQTHHLPVLNDHEVVGLLSVDDVLRAEQRQHDDDSTPLTAGDICHRNVALVDLNTRLDIVLEAMAKENQLSVIVMRKDRIAGILTSRDVCRISAQWIRKMYVDKPSPDIA